MDEELDLDEEDKCRSEGKDGAREAGRGDKGDKGARSAKDGDGDSDRGGLEGDGLDLDKASLSKGGGLTRTDSAKSIKRCVAPPCMH